MHLEEIEARLRASPLFRDANAEILRGIARETSLVSFTEGQTIWAAGHEPTHFSLVLRGLVQVVRRHPNGEMSSLGLFGPRETVGTVAVLQRRPYPAEAVALSETVDLLAIRAAPVLELMSRTPALANAFNADLCGRAEMLRSRIDVLSAGSVPRRIATLLLALAERFGDSEEGGPTRIPVALSRVAIGRLVSARVETVIRVVSEWQKQSLISTDATGFDLHDVAALERVTEEG